MTTGKALVAVLAGVTAGAVIGILLAPDKGKRTRKKIIRNSQDLADAMNDRIDEKFELLRNAISGK